MPPLCAVVCVIVNTTLFITLPTESEMGIPEGENKRCVDETIYISSVRENVGAVVWIRDVDPEFKLRIIIDSSKSS